MTKAEQVERDLRYDVLKLAVGTPGMTANHVIIYAMRYLAFLKGEA